MAMRTFPPPPVPSVSPPREIVSTFWTWVALLFALIGVAGTLYLSIGQQLTFGMDLVACPLCFYQRTFILSLAAALFVGLLAGPRRSGYLSLITLPLTVAGLAIAAYHVYLEYDGRLKCPDGALLNLYEQFKGQDDLYKQFRDMLTPPKESLVIFVLIFLVQGIDVLRSSNRGGYGFGPMLAAIIVGGLLAAGAWATKDGSVVPENLPGCHPHKAAG
jgi:hypothetical protein